MIGKISARGARVAGLMYYLYGPGRNEAHTDPHLVAGWRHPSELEPPLRDDGRRDFRHLNGLLQQPHAALGPRGFDRPVWHCSVRAAPGDRMLCDDEWAQVAHDIVHRTGLAPRGQDDDAVRWIAVRHAPDHMHIVAMLARQDGTRPSSWNDYYRVGEACRAAEERFGLRRTPPRDRTGAPRPTRAESEKAQRQGRSEPPRITLRRAVSTAAAAAASEHAVALPADTTRTGAPVWYSGGKLAPDLTLPKLRHRWAPSGTTARDQFTAAERNAIWEHAAQAASRATAEIRHLAGRDPGAAADAAWAAADTLHAAASALGSREVRQAADSYARAARIPYGHIPRHTAAGTSLRRAARLLAAATPDLSDPTLAQIALVFRLAALIEAVADLRAAQRHAAQAAAARAAAAHLHSARCAYGVRAAPQHMRSRCSRTHPDFPFSIRDVVAQASKTAGAAPDQSMPGRASRGPAPPRPRGPTR
jgi:hypothetical protein